MIDSSDIQAHLACVDTQYPALAPTRNAQPVTDWIPDRRAPDSAEAPRQATRCRWQPGPPQARPACPRQSATSGRRGIG
ncbi:hypothetical protein XFF6166_460027 [Xanthomonas citri pv. fuscans]|nr:hypothetical protein XFF6166_460027 [Xanthomonas citri pv. fuscans]SOO02754.1 hypothetical protein XFF6960_70027 [Xanthomonas citri pv. fuscans]SOO44230.1 hypothetical protein XFF1815_470027 [Xanthomonas citri pv. fuscans]